MNKGNKMYDYLLNHNYISENKKSNYQSELSVERAECIANKSNSLVEEENTSLKQALIDIKEVINGEEFFLLMNSEPSRDKAVCEDYFKGKELISKIIGKVLGENNG